VRVAVAEGLALLGASSAVGTIPESDWQAGADATGSAGQAEGRRLEADWRDGTGPTGTVGHAESRILAGGPQAGVDAVADAELRRVLALLAGDRDPLVRAAAFKAAGAVGCPPPLDAIAARALAAGPEADNAWQARAGAAVALAAARPQLAVEPPGRPSQWPSSRSNQKENAAPRAHGGRRWLAAVAGDADVLACHGRPSWWLGSRETRLR
jgi:hypothetical protein